jgi:radical SAM superfamily enzyme YgiQ (UPF0313 family)
MKILLLNPPTRNSKKFIREGRCTQEQGVWATLWPPISLVMIGAVLEKDEHVVRIIDCPAEGVSWEDLMEEIRKFSPNLVTWSTGTPSIGNDLSLASDIKEINPAILTAVFGTHVTVLDKQCMAEFPCVDFIIRNEPEMTARELVNVLEEARSLEAVAGITFRDHNGEIISNPSRPFIENLDSLPVPSWHLINIGNYTLPIKGRKFLIVAPQRGCPFDCSFCTCQTYYGQKLRKRTVNHVMEEIEYDIKEFNVRDFFFWAETFVVDKGYVTDLCQAILDKGLKISWTCNSRVDIVDTQLLNLMSRAGCWMISYGIESGEQKILDKAGKGIKVEQAYNAVLSARKAGIKTAGHFIFGLPGDTEQSMEKTIRLSRELGLDIAQFYCCVPFPGSRLYEEAEKQGWIRGCDFSSFSQGNAVMQLPTVSASDVNRCRVRAYRSFYLSPSSWYRIFKLTNYKGVRRAWKTARDFLHWSG